jgi:hypothetical protein
MKPAAAAAPSTALLVCSMLTPVRQSLAPLHCLPLQPLQERWEMKPAAAASGDSSGNATYTGNSSNLAGSYTPFSSGSRACLGQVNVAGSNQTAYSCTKLQITNYTCFCLARGFSYTAPAHSTQHGMQTLHRTVL